MAICINREEKEEKGTKVQRTLLYDHHMEREILKKKSRKPNTYDNKARQVLLRFMFKTTICENENEKDLLNHCNYLFPPELQGKLLISDLLPSKLSLICHFNTHVRTSCP